MKFGHSILRKIIKIVATECHILQLKCTNSISAGALPQTPLAELTALPQKPVAAFKGPTSKGREGRVEKGRRGGR